MPSANLASNFAPDFVSAREAMVLSQLHPSGVVTESVLAAFRSIPREIFVPEAQQGVCYLDEDLPLSGGRYLMEPVLHGRMIEEAHLNGTEKVLDIGCFTGYSAAVLSKLAGGVIAVDQDSDALALARANWHRLGLENIAGVCSHHVDGFAKAGPYDAIFINGAVPAIPSNLVAQLSPKGRLLCLVCPEGQSVGKLVRVASAEAGGIQDIMDGATPYLVGFAPVPHFAF
jgi:protein-L-isoaspartate(D-aspartate) O-methyltransferase